MSISKNSKSFCSFKYNLLNQLCNDLSAGVASKWVRSLSAVPVRFLSPMSRQKRSLMVSNILSMGIHVPNERQVESRKNK